jgi:hypothetical protein
MPEDNAKSLAIRKATGKNRTNEALGDDTSDAVHRQRLLDLLDHIIASLTASDKKSDLVTLLNDLISSQEEHTIILEHKAERLHHFILDLMPLSPLGMLDQE